MERSERKRRKKNEEVEKINQKLKPTRSSKWKTHETTTEVSPSQKKIRVDAMNANLR
jgi:hypothetical protein